MNVNAVREMLRTRGCRLTPSRRVVAEAALSSDEPFSVADVQRRTPQVGRATVFRTIKMLVDLDLLCRVLLEDGTPRYRLRRLEHHHHLVCTVCGDVEDFVDCDLEAMSAELAGRTNYEIQGHRLELFGLCPTCQVSSR